MTALCRECSPPEKSSAEDRIYAGEDGIDLFVELTGGHEGTSGWLLLRDSHRSRGSAGCDGELFVKPIQFCIAAHASNPTRPARGDELARPSAQDLVYAVSDRADCVIDLLEPFEVRAGQLSYRNFDCRCTDQLIEEFSKLP